MDQIFSQYRLQTRANTVKKWSACNEMKYILLVQIKLRPPLARHVPVARNAINKMRTRHTI